ncbi:MAG: winged helix-turn-helix transcriptional regulator [Planctomycetes bacterium]|nr:winged helix-turn-helix transcriptional regulator [Planctomycetota bacterium]
MDRHPVTSRFAAFADPTRLRVLLFLREGPLCVGDLVTLLGVPQPTASRQLANLREAGLVRATQRGLWVFYALAEPVDALHAALLETLAHCPALAKDLRADEKAAASLRRKGGCCPLESDGPAACCSPSAKADAGVVTKAKSSTSRRPGTGSSR